MSREEVKELLMIVQAYYPNFNPPDKTVTVNAWFEILKDYEAPIVKAALKVFVTSDSQFAPKVGELLAIIRELVPKSAQMTGLEAWGIVRKAISRGNYYAKEDFEKMPESVQKAIGNYEQIRVWASDTEYNEGVAQSNFLRSYHTVVERQKRQEAIPEDVKALIGQMQTKLIGEKVNEV